MSIIMPFSINHRPGFVLNTTGKQSLNLDLVSGFETSR